MTLDIKSLINEEASDEGIWVEYVDRDGNSTGFSVKIAYYGRREMDKIYKQTRVRVTDLKSLNQVEQIDMNKFKIAYANLIVRDWKGLTVKVLRLFLPVKIDAPEDAILECTEDNKVMLISTSSLFDAWVANIASDVTKYNETKRNDEIKNS